MTIDGFDPHDADAFVAFSWKATERTGHVVDLLARALGVQVRGIEHLPKGRALIVANHAFGYEVAFPITAITRSTGRAVHSLGEHVWWKLPFIRRFVPAIGVVDGTPQNIDALLRADQLVLVTPGGLRESVKPRELRYRLMWGRRYGFVRAAIRNRAPVVPLACIGGDEVWSWVGNPYERGRRWIGRDFPIPRPWGGLPVPHRVKLRYTLGEPIELTATPEQEHDPAVLRRSRHEIEGALHELIDIELARRAGFDIEDVEPCERG